MTDHNNPEDLNLQQHYCGNLNTTSLPFLLSAVYNMVSVSLFATTSHEQVKCNKMSDQNIIL